MTVVLSDLDGVLVDSQASIMRAWRRWAGRTASSARRSTRFASGGRRARSSRRSRRDSTSRPRRGRSTWARPRTRPTSSRCPARPSVLRAFGPDAVAVVTSCIAELAEARLRAAGLEPPAVLVTSDRLRRGKPDPEGYLLAARELGADPAACVVFEDSPGGVRAGVDAGMRVVGVLTTHAAGDLADAHERVATVAEWLERHASAAGDVAV